MASAPSPLGLALVKVLDEYDAARTASPNKGGHPLARFIADDLAAALRAIVPSGGVGYLVKGSPGQGAQWADTPWVAAFDPQITTSAQRGFYVVYLFRRDGSAVYLSLNQGTTEVEQEYGAAYREVLRRRGDEAARQLKSQGVALGGLLEGGLTLVGGSRLTRGYEAGNVAAMQYDRGALRGSAAGLETDLRRLLDIYRELADLRVSLGLAGQADEEVPSGVEPGRFRWHLSPERDRTLAKKVKAFRGSTCEVCGFDFGKRYGPLGAGFIEAHHLTPMASLKGRPTNLDATDFAVLCSNCHRMIHRTQPQLTPAALKATLLP